MSAQDSWTHDSLQDPTLLNKPRTNRTYKRWQPRHPNSLWQRDPKVVDSGWLITILDDHSRSVTGSKRFNEGTTENAICLPWQAIHEYAKSGEILTDPGSQFANARGGGIGKPLTPDKIERWAPTYDLKHARFPLHGKFIGYYNHEHPHMALDYSTRAIYLGSVPNVMG